MEKDDPESDSTFQGDKSLMKIQQEKPCGSYMGVCPLVWQDKEEMNVGKGIWK